MRLYYSNYHILNINFFCSSESYSRCHVDYFFKFCMKSLLERINSPRDLRQLDQCLLHELATELRQFILKSVAETGGHLASNLGIVELTIALHYVFNTPDDRIIWDVGHQSYAHKILTGRRDKMLNLRKKNGLSGFPKKTESIYDVFGTAHSSTALSATMGMAVASQLKGEKNIHIAVIGDGAMSAGQAFEALNNVVRCKNGKILVILNDNSMSISKSVGALHDYLSSLRSQESSHFEGAKRKKQAQLVDVGRTFFDQFGFRYSGPVDGHDLHFLIINLKKSLALLKETSEPQLLHVVTKKGKGYKPAEDNPVLYHGVNKFNPCEGYTPEHSKNQTYSELFSEWLCEVAEKDKSIVAITPAMSEGSGLVNFFHRFPDRYFDVGIAEQHAITFAGGLAASGFKPIVAIYSTFLQRGYDQLIHDVAIQNLPVIFAIDRAGLSGADGATHAGAFDIAFLRCVPNITIMVPSDLNECRHMFELAILKNNGPIAIRYPRGMDQNPYCSNARSILPFAKAKIKRLCKKVALDDLRLLMRDKDWLDDECRKIAIHNIEKNLHFDDYFLEKNKCLNTVAIVAFGSMVGPSILAAKILDATVVDMRFVKPLDYSLLRILVKSHNLLVFIEEGTRLGGAGSACLEFLTSIRHGSNFCDFLLLGLPDKFSEHGERNQLLGEYGLNSEGIVNAVQKHFLNKTNS